MIDFIEYVVSELKSKRLPKGDALALIKQFSLKSSAEVPLNSIHPLLHINTSDLNQQSYSALFNGDEFFLTDHQIRDEKILPAVIYLEMARAAIEAALPEKPESSIMELKNVVWIQPMVVTGPTKINIALLPNEIGASNHERIDFEIYSSDSEKEIIHCQGQARFIQNPIPPKVDMNLLRSQMEEGEQEASTIYAAFKNMGVCFGPAHQGVKSLLQGDHQVLSQLSLSEFPTSGKDEFLLHPSLMDSAIQSSIGMYGAIDKLDPRPSLPFALASLKIFAPCTEEMFAWVRYSRDSKAGDNLEKLDIDLLDAEGNVYVQMEGYTSRLIDTNISLSVDNKDEHGLLMASREWKLTEVSAINEKQLAFTQNHIILYNLPEIQFESLKSQLIHCNFHRYISTEKDDISGIFSQFALYCFEKLQSIIKGKPVGKVLVQIIVPDVEEKILLRGLNGLLHTASIENPNIDAQIVFIDAQQPIEKTAEQLVFEYSRSQETIVRYQGGQRHILNWNLIPEKNEDPLIPFKDNGVYVITGGLGSLGIVFAKEILKHTSASKVILTGRSDIANAKEKQRVLKELKALSTNLEYCQLNLTDSDEVAKFIDKITKNHHQLNGIIHSAGMITDNYILKKTNSEFSDVLKPKVMGTYNLDNACKHIDLDFFVLFSSLVSAFGNAGQSDYAAANGFMDEFAHYRNALCAKNMRYGKTLSINWPFWSEGGMKPDETAQKFLLESTGMYPMNTDNGVRAFYHGMELPYNNILVIEGKVLQLKKFISNQNLKPDIFQSTSEKDSLETSSGSEITPSSDLFEKAKEYLVKQISEVLKLPVHKIDAQAPMEKYGIDSILAMNLTNHLEKTFGSLPKTLFYEYQTIKDLTGYFVQSHSNALALLLNKKTKIEQPYKSVETKSQLKPELKTRKRPNRRFGSQMQTNTLSDGNNASEPIAIIGLSGRYPEALNIEEYWNNLRNGKDCITEVPKARWDWREYYSEDRSKKGSHYSKWGGFIEGVDEFDPRFFNISPREAEYIDPQERLFLQHAWMAVEDAGYNRASLQIPGQKDLSSEVGVYAGLMYSEYQLFGVENSVRGKRMAVPGSYASVANRVSYVLDLHGPSITLDTMCSSSLAAIHLACQDLKLGRTHLGIAGGVNLSIHPNKYLFLSAGQFVSTEGRCQSFGEGGDGYIPGEGVGVVILKRFSEAVSDGDHIYGVIKGSALNHGGKTNGYSVPNPQAQAAVITRALTESGVKSREISYVEAHGTGTKLGDPIEIAALSKAFQEHTSDKGYCLIGSSKSNIGHCESAAGMAGLTKVLLQLKYQKIAPSLHSNILNPYIDFERTPFIVNQTLRNWDRPTINGKESPRIAGLSAFGAGGANAHLIVQEYLPKQDADKKSIVIDFGTEYIIPLSARTKGQLKQKVNDLQMYLEKVEYDDEGIIKSTSKYIDMASLAFTLQTGRETMEERVGFIVSNSDELLEKLMAYSNDEQDAENIFHGPSNLNMNLITTIGEDADFEEVLIRWIKGKKFTKILELWVNGLELNWIMLYDDVKPPRISLPTYPFAKEKYWVDVIGETRSVETKKDAFLHPLLHVNTSNFNQQSYKSSFSGREFFIIDYQIDSVNEIRLKMLSALALLEMVFAAAQKASNTEKYSKLELTNIQWGQPCIVENDMEIKITLFETADNKLDFELFNTSGEEEVVYCLGEALVTNEVLPSKIELAKLKGQLQPISFGIDMLYQRFSAIGIEFNADQMGIVSVVKDEYQLLAQLRLPTNVETSLEQYVLHPSLMDSVLQASMVFLNINSQKYDLFLPIALSAINVLSNCEKEMYVWVRAATTATSQTSKHDLHIDLCDDQGKVCIQLRGLTLQKNSVESQSNKIAEIVQLTQEIQSQLSHAVRPQSIALTGLNDLTGEANGLESITKPKTIQLTGYTDLQEAIPLTDSKPSQISLAQDVWKPSENTVNEMGGEEVKFGRSREELLAQLKISLAEALYLDVSDINGDKSFVDLGLDSIIGVEWIKGINSKYRLDVSATKVYDYSTVKKFAAFLIKEIDKSYQLSGGISNGSLKPNSEKTTSIPNPIHTEDTMSSQMPHTGQQHSFTKQELQNQLKSSLAKALYLSPDEISLNKSFVDMGLDSIVGVEWTNDLNKHYGLDISATKVYDYSTISKLASHLEKEIVKLPAANGRIQSVVGGQIHTEYGSTVLMREFSKDAAEYSGNGNSSASGKNYSKDQVQVLLTTTLGEALYLNPSEILIDTSFVDLGLDSIVGVEWVKSINKNLGLDISATVVYDYSTVRKFSSFVYKQLQNMGGVYSVPEAAKPFQVSNKQQSQISKFDLTRQRWDAFPVLKRKQRSANKVGKHNKNDGKIAIVGMSGRYPESKNMQEYWNNLVDGKNSVSEIPLSRWDVDKYYDPDPTQKGKMYCKWLGALDDVDHFDPLFFHITPAEAENMDPQHRIFLQEAYKAFEDAGYSNTSLSDTKCGVYMGIMSNDYSYYQSKNKSDSVNITGNSFAIGVARIAYFLNLKGPAIPIDTACSSSLVATHIACQALLNSEIDMALTGGVSLYLVPEGYVGMCEAGMLSPQGQCKTFDDSANGFVPGEGVGALVLKRLEDAERDNDHIYGVILGSGINQDGKTNGITAPSVNSQIELERDLYARYNIDPESISYIETHGTGTKLGDPIELEALATVFKEKTSKKNFCALGSVKSNIGHTSGAAGIASVQKVLLSMEHQTLVPTLHVTKENALFDFTNSPFYISKEKQAWKTGSNETLRRAAVSSFGYSGTNAHLVLEEYPDTERRESSRIVSSENSEVIIPISARTTEQLEQRSKDLLEFIRNNNQPAIDLIDLTYTLQVGRDAMKKRLGLIVHSVDDLAKKLEAYISGRKSLPNTYEGQVEPDIASLGTETDIQNILKQCLFEKNWTGLLELWVKGVEFDWSKLYGDKKPRRINLPTYPFAKERYWVDIYDEEIGNHQIQTKKIDAQNTKNVQETVRELLFKPKFIEQRISRSAMADGKFKIKGPLLILSPDEELVEQMKETWQENAEPNLIITIKWADSYKEVSSNTFILNPEKEEHFYKLVKNLSSKNCLPSEIIHIGTASQEIEKLQGLDRELDENYYGLFYLSKALMKEKIERTIRFVSFFESNQDTGNPINAAIGGFLKSLSIENQVFKTKSIEILKTKEKQELSISDRVRVILDEFEDDNWRTNEIRYSFQNTKQEAVRSVRVLEQYADIENNMKALPFKHRGVYLVSGGIGGLGYIFSEYLVKKYQCRLVLFGRSALNEEQEVKIEHLNSFQSEAIYMPADSSKLEDMEKVVALAKKQFSQINGVIHSAGVNCDSLILNKSKEEIEKVFAPKIKGALYLDHATKDEKLDIFTLFSSIAGVFGNAGQCDYAYANHFMDNFAESRDKLVKANKRFGKSLSINWPYWEEGGMLLSRDELALAKKQSGICPLPTLIGIQILETLVSSKVTQGVALYGYPSIIKSRIEQLSETDKNMYLVQSTAIESEALLEKTGDYLSNLIGEEIKLNPERIDPRERFEVFGIDSIVVSRLNISLEKDLGSISKTLFYEYSTIEELAHYLTHNVKSALVQLFNMNQSTKRFETQTENGSQIQAQKKIQLEDDSEYDHSEPIAIIGVHGSFPNSEDVGQYWENLKRGKDLVDLVPSSRWNYEDYYHEDPEKAAEGKIYCKWGGFLDDVDKFDASFFNIPEEEANVMDPQERLFLQSVWASIEDAGYTRDSLKKCHPKGKSADVGVYVGVTTNSYNLLGATSWDSGTALPGGHPWSIANRISYFFDFQGASVPVDTACSSSLVAIHMACESLRKKECQVAIAGGVNLYLHPSKYHSLCKKRMVSLKGKCRSFGAGDDGFVPGEGVGSILLKPLSKAVKANDNIYAVIKGNAFDHSGRSNGYLSPNPTSQTNLISKTLVQANIHPETISYVECHGTGTQLGDSLEIVALTNAFRKDTAKKQFCPVGSVKSNIGHTEAAAGITGVAKVLMQLKHRQLAPTIHSKEVNPNIEFKETPFYLQHELSAWESPSKYPRRALINSFGAGGVNACLILEEFKRTDDKKEATDSGPYLFVLSARDQERLKDYVNHCLGFIGKNKHVLLENLCFTLQTGRDAMQERLAIIISDRSDLMSKLNDWRQQKMSDQIYEGSVQVLRARKIGAKQRFENDIHTAVKNRDLVKVASIWVKGKDIDWEGLYPENKPTRITLPTYPFAKERHWVAIDPELENKGVLYQENGRLHPLVSYNSSTLREISFSSLLSESEYYALDHRVNNERIFPGSGFLEMASISGNLAGENKVCKIKDIVWMHPLSFMNGSLVVKTSLKPNGIGTDYQISSMDDENEKVVHAEGKLIFQDTLNHKVGHSDKIPIEELIKKCSNPRDENYFYSLFEKAGLTYGPAYRTVKEFYVNESFALAKLELANHLKDDFNKFILHPSLLDGALQTVAGLIGEVEPSTPYLPFAIDEIELIKPLPPFCYAYVEFSTSGTGEAQKGIKKFNIQLLNKEGEVLIKLKDFYARALANK